MGIPIAAKHPQKTKGAPGLIDSRLLPTQGEMKAPTMETVLASPMAVPP
jgi:hypothetical protein